MVDLVVAMVIAEISLIQLYLDKLGVHAQVANDGVLLQQLGNWRLGSGLFNQPTQRAVAERRYWSVYSHAPSTRSRGWRRGKLISPCSKREARTPRSTMTALGHGQA